MYKVNLFYASVLDDWIEKADIPVLEKKKLA